MEDLSKILVAGELRYFGSPTPKIRPVKATGFPMVFAIGKITRPKNLSLVAFIKIPESIRNCESKPCDNRYCFKCEEFAA